MKLASFRAGGIERIGVETSAGMADIAALIDSPADMIRLIEQGPQALAALASLIVDSGISCSSP